MNNEPNDTIVAGEGEALSLDEVQDISEPVQESIPTEPQFVPDFDPLQSGQKIAKETVVLELHVRKPGFVRSINAKTFQDKTATQPVEGTVDTGGQINTGGDPDFLHISQDLLDRKALKAIDQYDYKFINWLWERRVPCKMLAHGMFLLPLESCQDVDVALQTFIQGRNKLVNELGDKYAPLVEDAKQKRGVFYSDSDYPPFEVIRQKYRVEAQYLTFNVPAALEQINREIYEREKEKAKIQWATAAEEVRDALRTAWLGLVQHFAERLGKDETGKPKTFHATAIGKIKDFIDTFHNRDLTDDVELQGLVKQAKDLVSGHDASDVRKNEALRDTLEANFKKLAENASKLIVVKERTFALAEDEDEMESKGETGEAPPSWVASTEDTAPALSLDDVNDEAPE